MSWCRLSKAETVMLRTLRKVARENIGWHREYQFKSVLRGHVAEQVQSAIVERLGEIGRIETVVDEMFRRVTEELVEKYGSEAFEKELKAVIQSKVAERVRSIAAKGDDVVRLGHT